MSVLNEEKEILVPQKVHVTTIVCDHCGCTHEMNHNGTILRSSPDDWMIAKYNGRTYDFCPTCVATIEVLMEPEQCQGT